MNEIGEFVREKGSRITQTPTDWPSNQDVLLTDGERARLAKACVAVPGLGGVGGWHIHALAKLGVGSFHLADLDIFETVNIQRQIGADLSTLGRSKVDVAVEQVLAINPTLGIKTFPKGVQSENMNAFLDGVDVVVDGLDFFAIDTRRILYAACRQRGIPVVDAGPVGLGTAVMVFLPDGPDFDSHFGLHDEMTFAERLLAHGLGHAPRGASPIDPAHMDFEKRRLPALGLSCMLCGATAATECLKILLHRGPVTAVPNGRYIDLEKGGIQPLRRTVKVGRGLMGKFIRRQAFRLFPGLGRMHLKELADRGKVPQVAAATT